MEVAEHENTIFYPKEDMLKSCLRLFWMALQHQGPQPISYLKTVTAVACKAGFTNEASQLDDESIDRSFELYDGHIATTFFQKSLLSIGSSMAALLDPARGDMVAIFGETTGISALEKMKQKMECDEEGSEILREKPRINSSTVDLNALRLLPEGTLGKAYVDWLDINGVSPDTRLPVQFVDDPELAYIMQRYREVHDMVHTVLGMPTNMLGEVAVKWVEGIQTGLPMCVSGGIFGAVRLKPKQRQRYLNSYLPWAIKVGQQSKFLMNVYYEKRWSQNLEDLRNELNISTVPEL